MLTPWPRRASRPAGDFRIFKLRWDTLYNPHRERESEFVILDSPDWVNVIPLTPDGQVVFIRQFRAGTGRVTLEVPGGMVDPGETPAQAAGRELLEETGYTSARLEPLGVIEPNPAFQTNRCWSFVARDCQPTADGATHFDSNEYIEHELIPLARVPQLLCDETITHALVAIAFQKLALRGG